MHVTSNAFSVPYLEHSTAFIIFESFSTLMHMIMIGIELQFVKNIFHNKAVRYLLLFL